MLWIISGIRYFNDSIYIKQLILWSKLMWCFWNFWSAFLMRLIKKLRTIFRFWLVNTRFFHANFLFKHSLKLFLEIFLLFYNRSPNRNINYIFFRDWTKNLSNSWLMWSSCGMNNILENALSILYLFKSFFRSHFDRLHLKSFFRI